MFEAGPHFGKPENFISQIIYNIPTEPINYDKEINVSDDWSGDWLIPEESGHFSYNGSIPYPPCTQVYKTFVYEKIGKIGVTNIETFKKYLGNNARPVRSLENRTIFYTPFLKNKFSEKKVFRSTNKYLKCYRENRPANITDPEPSQQSTDNEYGINNDTLRRIHAIGLSIIILLLFINAFYFAKWLFRHFYVQKAMRFISGREKIGYDTIKLWKGCQGKILTPRDKQLIKEAKEKAQDAINRTAKSTGMQQMGVSPTSMSGVRNILRSTQQQMGQQGMYGQAGSQMRPGGMGQQQMRPGGMGQQSMYGKSGVPPRGSTTGRL